MSLQALMLGTCQSKTKYDLERYVSDCNKMYLRTKEFNYL